LFLVVIETKKQEKLIRGLLVIKDVKILRKISLLKFINAELLVRL